MKKYLLILLLALASAGLFAGAVAVNGKLNVSKPSPGMGAGQRIISLAPSVTEALFALGLGDRIIGVTRQCLYPPEAATITQIGGYYDPNYEQIMRLKPGLVVMLPEHVSEKEIITGLGLRVLVVNHFTVDGIVRSFSEIGAMCGAEEKAIAIVADLNVRMDRIKKKTDGLPRPRVMVSLGRGMASGSLKDLFIAGKGTFYDDLITLAGGTNVYTGKTVRFPQVELEGIYKLDPDIVIDMVPNLVAMNLTREMVAAEWEKAVHCDAVKNRRVYFFEEDYATVPGPRFILTLEKMAQAIHPEAAWE